MFSTFCKAQPQKLIHFWDFNNTIPLTGIGDVGGNGDSLGNVIHPLFANYTTLPLTFPKIVYSRPKAIQVPAARTDSVLDNDGIGSYYYDFSSSHYPYYIASDSSASAAACACSGNLYIQARNPTLNSYLYMYVPTTGYINVTLSYAISATNNKAAQYNIFSYSTNGGSTWNKLTTAMDTFNIGGIKYPDTLLALNPITQLKKWYPVHINFTPDPTTNNNNGFIVRFFLAGSNATGSTGNSKYDNIAIQGDSICPVMWMQPQNATICNGENTDFVTKVVGGLNDIYQWQVNTGSGFTNISNGGVYNGATTDSLILTNVPPVMNGYTYRCIISCFSCNNDTSATALLTVNPPPSVTAS
ncbi:MAG TPA: hypothetical protein VNZ45_11370, partial [Bacteroidia bacterium]|nr:hypothetical protein [Bacteroidia bacterium]